MDISNLKKIYNKRNCVERNIFNYIEEKNNMDELLIEFFNKCKIENLNYLNKLPKEIFASVISYSIYSHILDKYINRGNVTYQNIKLILRMLDKSKDSIRDFLKENLELKEFNDNLNEFIEWVGISTEFHDEFLSTILVSKTSLDII
ncbi:hypothetical protein J2Z53_001488 [Clostridium moniliforme]|uniref:Uncharacterized protein n=1 Tax=Clostridium moniliforme TaxID=39489 RepID=A0ABS4F0X3_9CLOT|nr:hypothetical protein [Clostridium moniliforme]MBP1889905.1 hypothetical protein [Clostridium moniliforme]